MGRLTPLEEHDMALKEMYEEMSDEELLERYEDFQDYRDEAKAVILEELRKRKLLGEEEMEKKLDLIKKHKEEKRKEVKKIKEKLRGINGNNDKYFYFKDIVHWNENNKYMRYKTRKSEAFICMFFFIFMILISILNLQTVFWKENVAVITIKDKKEISYEYHVNDIKFKSDRLLYIGTKLFLGINELETVNLRKNRKIWYDERNPQNAVLIKGILDILKLAILISYCLTLYSIIHAFGYLKKSYLYISLIVVLIIVFLPGGTI